MGFMDRGKSLLAACALILIGFNVAGCSGPACDSMMRYNTLVLDASSLPEPAAALDLVISCPDRTGSDSCTMEPTGKRFALGTQSSVYIEPSVRAVRAVVYKKGSQEVVAETELNPVPWDPPQKPNTCPAPATATLKL